MRSRGARYTDLSRVDFWHLLANRLYFSSFYATLYIVMICVNLLIICWMLSMPGGYNGSLSFLIVQVLVNLVLVLEVVIRLISQKQNFFLHRSNIFDVMVMTVAIFAQLLYIHPPAVAAAYVTTEEWEELGATGFRILRDGVLFARLYIFMKNHRENQMLRSEEIDFDTLVSSPNEDKQPLLSVLPL